MEDSETPRMLKYSEWNTTEILMAIVPYVNSLSVLRKFQKDGTFLD